MPNTEFINVDELTLEIIPEAYYQKLKKLLVKSSKSLQQNNIFDTNGIDNILEYREKFQDLFIKCCTMFENLTSLYFYVFMNNLQLIFDLKDFISFSSNITELHIVVNCFNDCLYILDGSFSQLEKYYIIVYSSTDLPSNDHAEVS
ncbi:unnamed protein product [Adineta steineri]|uniref:Uncharacterized protein n=1 Tax=Adineta steineri TaxID=433720 RepID=A0A815DP77_9BILA|nr:unnamed protein product [Adineta steineri]CAF1575512.1 unnamed protein product [Adineta steineri]